MFGTAELCDKFKEKVRVLAPTLYDFGGSHFCFGIAVTIKCEGNNLGIIQLAKEGGKGRIMVVDDKDNTNKYALLNYQIANQMIINKWQGIIINGYIRNSNLLKELPITIKALGTVPYGSIKKGSFSLYEPLSFAGQRIISGDKIFMDNDGIIILNTENI